MVLPVSPVNVQEGLLEIIVKPVRYAFSNCQPVTKILINVGFIFFFQKSWNAKVLRVKMKGNVLKDRLEAAWEVD